MVGLFYAVGYWNAWFNALLYIDDNDEVPDPAGAAELHPGRAVAAAVPAPRWAPSLPPTLAIKMAVVVVTVAPIVAGLPVRAAALRQGRDGRRGQGLTPRRYPGRAAGHRGERDLPHLGRAVDGRPRGCRRRGPRSPRCRRRRRGSPCGRRRPPQLSTVSSANGPSPNGVGRRRSPGSARRAGRTAGCGPAARRPARTGRPSWTSPVQQSTQSPVGQVDLPRPARRSTIGATSRSGPSRYSRSAGQAAGSSGESTQQRAHHRRAGAGRLDRGRVQVRHQPVAQPQRLDRAALGGSAGSPTAAGWWCRGSGPAATARRTGPSARRGRRSGVPVKPPASWLQNGTPDSPCDSPPRSVLAIAG